VFSYLDILFGYLSKFLNPSYYSINMSQPNITLYTTQTPNGIKISIALEELGYVNYFDLFNIGTDRLQSAI
jgi:hypothetical protein